MVLQRLLIASIAVGGASDRAATLDTEIVLMMLLGYLPSATLLMLLGSLPSACSAAIRST